MLAMESVPSKGDTLNWNDGIRRLRAKPVFQKQLNHRLAAVEEGRKVATESKELCLLSDDDTCGLLWDNHNFRSKLTRAISHSQEMNAWASHDFHLTPSSDMFNHVMMSVEEVSSGEVAGFCEVAWLPSPSCVADDIGVGFQTNNDQEQIISDGDDSLDFAQTPCEESPGSYCDIFPTQSNHYDVPSIRYAPAIVNLVTSPSHRRMGIASRVLKFASKYTRT